MAGAAMLDQENNNPDTEGHPFASPQLQNGEFKAADMTETNFNGVNLTRAKVLCRSVGRAVQRLQPIRSRLQECQSRECAVR